VEPAPLPARPDARRRALLALPFALPFAALAAHGEAVFVVHPFDIPSRIHARFRPLVLYLGGAIGRTLRLIIAASYDQQIAMITDGRADYAYLGPTPYVLARERAPVRILAGETENGLAFYQSAVVVRSDSPARQLADLAGRRMAFGDPVSMSSTVAPKRMLAQAGVRLDDLGSHAHLDRHERVALAVLHGDFDAGGLRLDIAKTYLPRGLRILAVSQPLPPHVIAAASQVPEDEAKHARAALLHPDASGRAALRALGENTGFAAMDDAHYQEVKRMLRQGGMP
jgi:phosphonate transport system substrate-binding protein